MVTFLLLHKKSSGKNVPKNVKTTKKCIFIIPGVFVIADNIYRIEF